MADIKSILNSVRVHFGVVHFPSRYAAESVMEWMSTFCEGFSSSDYRILSIKDQPYFSVYFAYLGTLFDASDLSVLKEELGM